LTASTSFSISSGTLFFAAFVLKPPVIYRGLTRRFASIGPQKKTEKERNGLSSPNFADQV
jgi:hypothetical protein